MKKTRVLEQITAEDAGSMNLSQEIQVQNLDHLGLVAGIIDEIGLVEQINQVVGQRPGEIVSPGPIRFS